MMQVITSKLHKQYVSIYFKLYGNLTAILILSQYAAVSTEVTNQI